MRGWAILLGALLPASALAEPEPRYSVASLGYELRHSMFAGAASDQLLPRLAITHYGIDWYLRLHFGMPGTMIPGLSPKLDNSSAAIRNDLYLGRVEVGTHWAQRRFLIATGVYLAGQALDRGPERSLPPVRPHVDALGIELGAHVRAPLSLFDRVRIDPGIGVSGLYLDGGLTGIAADAEVDLLLKISASVSLQAGGSFSLRRYATAQDGSAALHGLSGSVARVSIGVALHDIAGLGSNDFEVRPVPGPVRPEPRLPFEVAPQLGLAALDGDQFYDLGEHVGTSSTARPVAISFGASYCEPCWVELPVYAALAASWAASGVTFIFVTVDETEAGRDKVRQSTKGLPLLVLSDPDQATARRWKVAALPQLFLVAGDGRILFHRSGLAADTLDRLNQALRETVPPTVAR